MAQLRNLKPVRNENIKNSSKGFSDPFLIKGPSQNFVKKKVNSENRTDNLTVERTLKLFDSKII